MGWMEGRTDGIITVHPRHFALNHTSSLLLKCKPEILSGSAEIGQNVFPSINWVRKTPAQTFMWKNRTFITTNGKKWRQFPFNWKWFVASVLIIILQQKIWARSLCTLEIIEMVIKTEDLKSRNMSVSQWASAVRSGKGVFSVSSFHSSTSCLPCPWQYMLNG